LPHVSNLPRLMQTNCIDVQHRGRVTANGAAGGGGRGSFPKGGGHAGENCHPAGAWPNNYWNTKTPWPPVQ
jgi:hypothetical protein